MNVWARHGWKGWKGLLDTLPHAFALDLTKALFASRPTQDRNEETWKDCGEHYHEAEEPDPRPTRLFPPT